jgi:hypothetical protein
MKLYISRILGKKIKGLNANGHTLKYATHWTKTAGCFGTKNVINHSVCESNFNLEHF